MPFVFTLFSLALIGNCIDSITISSLNIFWQTILIACKLNHSAPIHSNEYLVPLPTETLVASKKQIPGYNNAASIFCKAGDGFCQAKFHS